MYLPIRCFTCNKTLGHFSNLIQEMKDNNDYPPNETFYKDNKIERYCCKAILCSSVNIFEKNHVVRDESFYKLKNSIEVPRILTTD